MIRIAVNCSDHSQSTAQSLLAVLDVPNPPTACYMETVAPFYRVPVMTPSPPMSGPDAPQEQNVTTVHFRLLPRTRLNLVVNSWDEAEMLKEFSSAELAESLAQAELLSQTFEVWRDEHAFLHERIRPRINDLERGRFGYAPQQKRYALSASVSVYIDDKAEALQLAEELVALVEVAGFDGFGASISSRQSYY